jgi:hypothetical protein
MIPMGLLWGCYTKTIGVPRGNLRISISRKLYDSHAEAMGFLRYGCFPAVAPKAI